MAAISGVESHTSGGRDVEKDVVPAQTTTDLPEDSKQDLDDDSTHVQEGVKRVEAITAVWSQKSLWSTFALYASPRYNNTCEKELTI